MNNPSGTTHSREIPGVSELEIGYGHV